MVLNLKDSWIIYHPYVGKIQTVILNLTRDHSALSNLTHHDNEVRLVTMSLTCKSRLSINLYQVLLQNCFENNTNS